MKRLVLFMMTVMVMGSAAMAQLGAPKITVKDTLMVASCYYNGVELAMEDWPAVMLIEDAVQIQIADYVYKKGRPTYQDLYSYNSSWGGYIDYYRYSATCNGKKADVSVVKPRSGCDTKFYGKYIIDDYEFYVMKAKDFAKMLGEVFGRLMLESESDDD